MRRVIGALALALFGLLPAGATLASTTASFTVSITIPEYPLVATVLPGCAFDIDEDTEYVDCTVVVLLSQPTFETDGWRLELSVTDVRDDATSASLPLSSIYVSGYGDLFATAGQAVDAVGGPSLADGALLRSLDTPRTVAKADPGFGNGFYRAELHLRLEVPENATAGSYVPSFALSVSSNLV